LNKKTNNRTNDTQIQKPGDLIEISRGLYQHWAIYVGEGYVIHLAPPSEDAQAGPYSMMSVLCDKAKVKKEELYEVVGNDEYCINNLLDEKYEPRPVREMLQDAHRFLGRELPYCVFRENCEHFVTELRYGKPQSRAERSGDWCWSWSCCSSYLWSSCCCCCSHIRFK
uniref:Retinoic acid receptor responder 3-like n=1 Tax=Sinocyclocheilus grahami TaxID=75366 RepID=A0A672MSJ2_SINGR